MTKFELIPIKNRDSAWSEAPPDPLADPDLYDGIAVRRVIAYAIDVAILVLVLGLMWVLVILSLGLLWPAKLILAPLLPVLYHTYFIGACGATPGMQVMDVEIRSFTGQRPDYFQAFLMTALFYVTVYPSSFLVLLVVLFNERRRTLHDFLAGTLAVRHSYLANARTGFVEVHPPS